MHGRLKVKTTAEQEEEKRKEQAVKQKKYLAGLNAVFKKREEKAYDSEALLITAQLLMANPDASTVWNYRREVLLAFKETLDIESYQKLLEDELRTTEFCLVKNPKSYGAWHHRGWVFEIMPSPPYEDELVLCDKYLQKDERNFHCWDHRRLIVQLSKRDPRDELATTQTLIEKNFSNFSAWHYRSKLLPCVYPPNNGPHPIPDDIFLQELKRIVTAVFTDPSDQSPWFFLRWLLARQERERERLLWIGVFAVEEGATRVFSGEQNSVEALSGDEGANLVLVFTKEASTSNFFIYLDDERIPNERIKPFDDRSCIWITHLPDQDTYNITIDGDGWTPYEKKSIFSLSKDFLPYRECCLKSPLHRQKISHNSEKTLTEIKDNFIMLDKIDHGNKWVLLSLVDILSMLQTSTKCDDVIGYLDHLEYADPLRVNYYKDLRSKIIMERKLRSWIAKEYESPSNSVDLSRLSLTRIVHTHYFSLVEGVNLSFNHLRNVGPLSSLINCVYLSLAGNPLQDLSPLQHILGLKELNIDSCGIKSLDQLRPLKPLKGLQKLAMAHNPLPTDHQDELKKDILSLISSLTNLSI